MKRIVSSVLALVLVASFTAVGGAADEPDVNADFTEQQEKSDILEAYLQREPETSGVWYIEPSDEVKAMISDEVERIIKERKRHFAENPQEFYALLDGEQSCEHTPKVSFTVEIKGDANFEEGLDLSKITAYDAEGNKLPEEFVEDIHIKGALLHSYYIHNVIRILTGNIYQCDTYTIYFYACANNHGSSCIIEEEGVHTVVSHQH